MVAYRPKALDLCAGAGGLSLGLQRAGFRVQGIELDADAVDTHQRNVGPCERLSVRRYRPTEPYDLVAGGVPCQPFSAAGLRLGLEDPRYLVPDFLRIAKEAEARAVLLENVRGLVRDSRAFRAVLDLFEAEYHTTWTVLDAADQGVPQNRDRVFVVGFKSAENRARFKFPSLTHWPPGSLFGAPYRTVREALSLGSGAHTNLDLPAPCVTATEQKSAMSGSQPMGRRRRASERLSEALGALDRPAPCVRANSGHETADKARASRRPMANVMAELGALDRPSPVITAGGTEGGGGAEPIANRNQRRELHDAIEAAAGLADRPATTVRGDPRLAIAGHHDRQQNGAVRLTVEQCALLQGFPAGWAWTGNKGSQHRQVGNAVPPALAEAMGRAVRAALLS